MKIRKFDLPKMYIELVEGTSEWYFGTHFQSDIFDLFEAEEIIKLGKNFPGNQLYFIHYPDGQVYSPFPLRENVYYERPVWDGGSFAILEVDFNKKKIGIYSYRPGAEAEELTSLDLSEVEDTYNLKIDISPLSLTRQSDSKLQIIWPEKREFEIGPEESMIYRNENLIYLSSWEEEPYYKESYVSLDLDSGERKAVEAGSLYRMPDGSLWNI